MPFEITTSCRVRCPSGKYIGYVCCHTDEHHEGDHIITRGKAEPPHYEVVYTWPQEVTFTTWKEEKR